MSIKRLIFGNLLVYILILTSCDPSDNRLNITNNYNHPVYYTYSSKEQLDSNNIRIAINQKQNLKEIPDHFYMIAAKTTENVALTGERWEAIANDSQNKKIHFFFFKEDTLLKYKWKEIVNNEKYLSVEAHSIDELKKNNWMMILP